MNIQELKLIDIKHQIDRGLILILTATEIESGATLAQFKPLPDFSSLIKVYEGNLTYVFGVFGNYRVAHVQCGCMGSISRESSITTTLEAINLLSPKFIIMIGVGFGVDEEKQNIGDVLVSEGVLPYNYKRVGKNQTILKSHGTPCSRVLLSRFRSINTWEYVLENKQKAQIIYTHLISGEELIDNKEHRENLKKEFPNAKGGEMEGAGLSSACDGKVAWIIVKGICDFADGNKGVDKKMRQGVAIESALSLCLTLFSSRTAFDELGINSIQNDVPNVSIAPVLNFNELLFDVYDFNKEKYYIKRDKDDEFLQSFGQYSLWLYGISGCGKSNLILRNLIKEKIEFIQISLACCVGLSIEDLFREIYFELKLKVGERLERLPTQNFVETSNGILALLVEHLGDKKIVIFIEEIPISDNQVFDKFVEKFISIMISKALVRGLSDVRFILSSINSPINFIPPHQAKIHEQIKFMQMNNWQEHDIKRLIELITHTLNLPFSLNLTKELLLDSGFSPRFIKKYFRNILACNATNEAYQLQLIKETLRELKHN